MVFSSHIFLFYFLPIFLFIYYFLLWRKINLSWINLFVTIASYVFYGWFVPWFVVLMLVSTVVDYSAGKIISKPGASERQRKLGLLLSIVVNLGLLGFFKYYMFTLDTINQIVDMLGGGEHTLHIMQVALPIGISFYTFQTLSYTIDVYRGDAPPVKDLRTFSCFVALFPQLIAGPIIRYNTVAKQLSFRNHTLQKFASGTALFMLGFAKKTILANNAGLIADQVFGANAPDAMTAWAGGLAYHFQIYFDFCGYSDMAVGIGRMLGFEYIRNFYAPYDSDSISDFWRRWHISLSTWFRDYVYIPLGGNRGKKIKVYRNLAITMFITALWHGAAWTFITWGMLHALIMIGERFNKRKAVYHFLPRFWRIILTNILVVFIWVPFRAPTLNQATLIWKSMLGLREHVLSASLLNAQVFGLKSVFFLVLCSLFVWQPIQAHDWVNKLSPAKYALAIIVFAIAIAEMFTQAFNPFLYFQF
jgi:alginate O-acetyltransferase complex protein AlgI